MKTIKKYALIILIIQLILSLTYPSHALEPKQYTPSGIELGSLELRVDELMNKYVGKSTPGAAVAVIKNGKIVLSKGYGYSDIETKKPVTKDTVFEYGSVSKLFVWTSVMQLVEQGKIDLDEDIKTYLPDDFYKELKLRYPITLRNIMNHSSGFGEYPYDLIALEDSNDDMSLKDALLLAHPKQYFEPGTASVYSNYATALAAYIVETVYEEEYYKYQKNHIFNPLNMDDIAGERSWKDNPEILINKAKGYSKTDKDTFKDSGWSYVGMYPAGSVIGTAEELALFTSELMPLNQNKTKLFKSNATINNMLSPSYEPGFSGTAHGFFEFDYPEKKAFGHGGNTASFSAQVAFTPEESFGFAVLTNVSGESNITLELQNLLLGSNKVEPIEDINYIDAHKLEGNYVSMRRPEGTPSEFVSYLALGKVEAVDNNKINFKIRNMSGTYIQTSPGKFSLTENSHAFFKVIMPEMTFRLDDEGNPKQILVGKGFDMSILPSNRTIPMLIGSLASFVIYLLFLVVGIISIIRLRIKSKRTNADGPKPVYKPRAILTAIGSILFANNIFLIATIITNPFIKYSSIKPIIILNYVITLLAIGFIVLGISKWKSIVSKSEKIWFSSTAVIVMSLISLLINWKFYALF